MLTGGLGPTEDDVTRLSVADALGLPLDEDPAIIEHIRARFARRDMEMPAVNRVQAQVLRGAVVLREPERDGAGAVDRARGTPVVLLPGPPREMRPMLDAVLAERLAPLAQGARLYRRVLKIAGPHRVGRRGRWRSRCTRPWRQWKPPVATSILAAPGQIELHFAVRAASAGEGADVLERATRRDGGRGRRGRLRPTAGRSNRSSGTCCAAGVGASPPRSRAPAASSPRG